MVLGYQNALRMFLEYLTDPAYGWSEQCWERFGDHPAQVFHDWNTARHAAESIAEPGKRPYTRDELEDLFDCADERVLRIRRSGVKGWLPAFRIATLMKEPMHGGYVETRFASWIWSTSHPIPAHASSATPASSTSGSGRR